MILERFAIWLVSKLPPPLVRDTERLGLSLGFIVVGLLSLAFLTGGRPSTAQLPAWVVCEWVFTLVLGGALTIWGIWFSKRMTERLGMMLAGTGCLTYGLTLITIGWDENVRQVLTGALFLIFALIKGLRLAVSTAAVAVLSERAREQEDQ